MAKDDVAQVDRRLSNICFVNPTFYGNTVGGAEVQLYLMAKGLASLKVYNVFYGTPDIQESHTREGIHIVKIGSRSANQDYRYSDFASALESVDPDLVLQLGRKRFTYYAARFCTSHKVPFIFGAASDIDCRYLRLFPRFFVEYPVRRALNPARVCRDLVMDIRTLLAMKTASLTIVQSRRQKTTLERVVKTDAKIFQNPHDVPSEESIKKEEPPVVLWLASVKSVKRPELFIEMAHRLKELRCRLILAGRMSEERYRHRIEAAQRAGVLEYMEEVTFEQSNDLIARAKLFVLTSMHEGLPNTLIQAWLRRTPTVSCGFDPDSMIESNGLGAYVTSVEDAVSAIKRLLENDEEYEVAATNARVFAERRFAIEHQSKELRDIIDGVIGQ